MVKNLVSRSILNLLDQICVQKFFFHGFYLYYMLDFVASYHCMQLQGRLMNQTRENEEKKKTLVLGPILAPLAQMDFTYTTC